MNLPFDIARCSGKDGYNQCKMCRRREPGHPTEQWYTGPIIEPWGCENYIEPVQTEEEGR